jgi:hypothetical protein
MILNELILSLSLKDDIQSLSQEPARNKLLFIIKVTQNLDPNLMFYLNAIKKALLMRSVTMRLVIIQG